MLDYIVVGKGIAGSLLANELTAADKKVLLIDDASMPSSSQVAGGMFNPVTGRHLAKTWLADELFPFLTAYYSSLQKETSARFFYPTGLYRPFVNEKQRQHFLQTIEKHDLHDYVYVVPSQGGEYSKVLVQPLGGLKTPSAGWVDVPALLKAVHTVLSTKAEIIDEKFTHEKLQITEVINYGGYRAKGIIFCEGFFAMQNPLFSWLPFNPVKGETLLIETASYPVREIVNQGAWVIPVGETTCRIGATYSWHELDFTPTTMAREELRAKIARFFKPGYVITEHRAGVRPSTTDRRPIIGPHPAFPNVFIFNGLGTKGVSLAPYFARQFRDFLVNGKELNPETTIRRFYPLY